jgi:hypothetical protein
MANLNSWQRIDRVIAGKPFGDGADGDYNSPTIPTMTYRSCSGSSGSTTLTLGSSGFSDGDLLLIHQTRGTGAGQWEINKISSGGGTTSLTLQTALQYTYTDSGASQAQAVKIPRYNDVTCPSGTWTVPSWDGDTGGILVLAAKGIATVTGTINNKGGNGTSNPSGGDGAGGTGGGFYGGTGKQGQAAGFYGEGTAGTSATSSNGNANGNGGGAGKANGTSNNGGAGGGGSNLSEQTGGSGGTASGGYAYYGLGGSGVSSSDLTTVVFGGGGGGGGNGADEAYGAGGGGSGGGIVFLIGKNISVSGAINTSGGHGSNGWRAGGGGGGGSILLVCSSATLGSSLVVSDYGGGGSSAGNNSAGSNYGAGEGASGGSGGGGGNGRKGAIALHYSSSYSGSTNPTLYANQDTSLVESAGGIFFHNFL